jgi:hypothetical protein
LKQSRFLWKNLTAWKQQQPQKQQPRQQQQRRLRGPKRLFDNQARPGQARYAQGLTDVVQPRGGPVDGLGKYLDSFFFLFSLGLKMETQLPAKTI